MPSTEGLLFGGSVWLSEMAGSAQPSPKTKFNKNVVDFGGSRVRLTLCGFENPAQRWQLKLLRIITVMEKMHKYLYLRLGVTTYNVVLSCTPVGASPTQFSHLPATHTRVTPGPRQGRSILFIKRCLGGHKIMKQQSKCHKHTRSMKST